MTILLFIILLLSLKPIGPNFDCVCVKPPNRSAEEIQVERKRIYDNATAVFVGKVVALDPYKVTFKLSQRWKGNANANEVVLSTGAVEGFDGSPLPKECSPQFKLGQEYLVYAFARDKMLTAGSCWTFSLNDSLEEQRGLDQIKL